MILVAASRLALSTLSLASAVGCGILGLGTTVADAVTQAPHTSMSSSDVWTLLMMIGFFVLCIKAIVALALFFHSYAPRLSVSTGNRFRWLFGTAFLLPVFASAACVLYPSVNHAFRSFARHVPAAVTVSKAKLWSFIQQAIAEPALIGNCLDKLGNFTQLLGSAKEAMFYRWLDVFALLDALEITVRLQPPILMLRG